MKEAIVIRLTGDSGDGVQLVGEQLTITAALSGRDVRTLPDFPAEIRAPAGTIAGVSGFQLAMADEAIFTAGETLDVLVALNPAALKHSLSFLKDGGILILNEDSFTEKDWKKAAVSQALLDDNRERYQVFSVPLISQTLQAVAGLPLSNTQAKKSKNFYVLGMVLWLFDLDVSQTLKFIQKKFKDEAVREGNLRTLKAGYDYAETLELSKGDFILSTVKRTEGDWRQLTGVEAVGLALATLSVTTETELLVSGYPITPASAILHEAAKLKDYGVALLQAEDEIAAICACLGASFGGKLALTCTSGPGLDLKAESLGLAVMAELPLVVVDVQRAGASTGLPTKTGQSDLMQALYGRHGEAPLAVLAARSPADCFYTIIEAFKIATRHMTPVIVLMDAYLANAAEPWQVPEVDSLSLPKWQFNRSEKPFSRDDVLARSWNIPGTPNHMYQVGGLEKQGEDGRVSYDADNHQHMVMLREEKIRRIADGYAPLQIEGVENASTLVISFGSTYGAVKGALMHCMDEDAPFAHLHLRHLNPLPNELGDLMKRFKKVLVVELNRGQLCMLLRAHYLVDAKSISQTNGQPFTVSVLKKAIKAEIHDELNV